MCTWNCQEGNSTADRVFHTFFIMGLFCVLQRILWEIWPVTRKNEHFPKGPSYKDIGHLGSLYPEFPRTKKLDWRYNLGIRSLSISFFAFLSIICINCTILYSESVFLLICCQNLPDAPFSPGTPPSSFLTCDYPHWGAVAEVCSSAHSGHHSRAGSCHPPVVHTSGSAAKRAPSTMGAPTATDMLLGLFPFHKPPRHFAVDQDRHLTTGCSWQSHHEERTNWPVALQRRKAECGAQRAHSRGWRGKPGGK